MEIAINSEIADVIVFERYVISKISFYQKEIKSWNKDNKSYQPISTTVSW